MTAPTTTTPAALDATPQEQFAAMCPDAPLPWERGTGRARWSIVDASRHEVCCFDGSAEDSLALINMVIVAVNTCGGYRAEIEWPTRHPLKERQS